MLLVCLLSTPLEKQKNAATYFSLHLNLTLDIIP